ncbi:MAG: DUF4386 domain-containing protein [Cyclobacteriaceae bacterium]
MKTQKKDFRITGFMYLLVIICAGFSQGYVRGTLVIPGDAAATALNITSNEGLFRLGLVTDLIAFLLDAAISVMFYQLLKPAGKTLALISSAFRLLAHPAIGALNLLNHYMAVHVLSGAEFLSSFDQAQLQTISLIFMDAHKYGYLLAGGFFAVHCLLLGISIFKSGMIPRVFGVLMALAAMGYFMETFGDFLFPGNEDWLALVVGFSAAVGEVGLTLYLLIKGAKKSYLES